MHRRLAKKIPGNTTRIMPAFVLLAFIVKVGTLLFSQSSAVTGPWSGQAQCQITVQGPYGYNHSETQTWTLNGGQPTMQGAMNILPATWSATGQGSFQKTTGSQTLVGQWKTNASPISAPLALFIRASDGMLILKSWHSQLTAPGSVIGTQQMYINGVAQTPGAISGGAFEWQFPFSQVPSNSTSISGSTTIATNGSVGPMQPGGSQGTASCTWNFNSGASSSSPAVLASNTVQMPSRSTPQTPINTTSVSAPVAVPNGSVLIAGTKVINPAVVTSPQIQTSVSSGTTTSVGPAVQAAPGGAATTPLSSATVTPLRQSPMQLSMVPSTVTSTQPGSGTGQQSSGTQTSSSASGSSTQNQTVSALTMNPPTPALAGPATVSLNWTAPANPGSTIDFYDIEINSGSGTTQLTFAAPATTATVSSPACPYPNVNCINPGNTVRFRVRAHNSTGYGAYSNYTTPVRPLVSYSADNVQSIWSAKQCTSCHMQGAKLDLSGTATNSYAEIQKAKAVASPAANSSLLACPSTNAACAGSHPGALNFSNPSMEYELILQWIQDGAQP